MNRSLDNTLNMLQSNDCNEQAVTRLEELACKKTAIYESGYYNDDIACAVDKYYTYLEKNDESVDVFLPKSGVTLVISPGFMTPQHVEVIFKWSGPIMDVEISGNVKNENDLRTFLQRRFSRF